MARDGPDGGQRTRAGSDPIEHGNGQEAGWGMATASGVAVCPGRGARAVWGGIGGERRPTDRQIAGGRSGG